MKTDIKKNPLDENAIIVQNVSKHFRIPREKRTTLRENFIGMIQGKQVYDEFWALRKVSFSIKKGETLGIIGENGSGKSTLLKLIAGVLYPDEGSIKVNGTIAPFLELGVGFQGDLTAKDNVYLYGSILGMTKKKMDEKYDEILEFAELKQFENMKLKNFSSGMYARLAFATAVASEPDILLLDEVLAVGDERFQMKCREKMLNFKKKGVTIILVSHSLDSIQSMCEKAILLEHGSLKASGNVWEVGDKYKLDMGIKRLVTMIPISPLENEIFNNPNIALLWEINNPLKLVEDIELRIRDITKGEDGKVFIFHLSNSRTQFKISEEGTLSGQNLIPTIGKKYRWSVRARSSCQSIYLDSYWAHAHSFSIV